MSYILMVLAVSTVTLATLCFKFYIRDKNGRIEIKLSGELEKDENTIMVTHTDLILKITYRIRKNSRYNKEQSAVLINDLILDRCASKGFKARKNTEFKEIEEIMGQIKLLLPCKTDSELTSVKYRILATTFTN